MKTKHILSTAAVFAGLISGAVLTNQTANAQSTTSAVTQTASKGTVEIDSVYYVHYNVLRAKLKTPVSASDYYLALATEGMYHKGTEVIENGKYVGFDLKLDDLIKKYPTVADREKLFDSLFIRSFSLDGSERPVTTKLTNQDLKHELLNHHFLGTVLKDGYAGTVSNLVKGSSFDKFLLEKKIYGDHLLEDGSITTKTGGVQFDFKQEMKDGYTYTVTDASGKVAGKAWAFMENFFVNSPEGKTFLPKEYTVTAKSDKTGEVYTLAKFTPTNIF
ncbi:hypothetical protein ACWOC1_02795 [Enterococcus quebecensis]|uniref:Uncharacterized protein n=1 Tax=Enterococcus quebecensis TaxID=903983 RepID=A0A1E5GSV7_9ENTE|nr:hypothetical protein [Enterococcus quebecensis]OEG15290.1 hypothetical protein BCR23_10680 [Enterococcus quebecensis]OJG74875.1 hypothetical protein RV12_GL002292 [Enterococcus quebecensis]